MKLFLLQNTCASPDGGRDVLFQIYNENGQPCACAEQLSGLFHNGYRLIGTLAGAELDVRASAARLPHGMIYTIYTDTRRRAWLSVLRDRLRIELDDRICILLGTPATGEYTVTNHWGQVLFSQQRQTTDNGRTVFFLTIPDDAPADVCLGLAVCLNLHLGYPMNKFAPLPAWF